MAAATRHTVSSTTNTFNVVCSDMISEIPVVLIGLDTKRPDDNLFIRNIEVIQPTKGRSALFRSNRWLGRSKEDGLVKRRFTVEQHPDATTAFQSLISYEAYVETADTAGAGTDCNITVQLFGIDGHTSRQLNVDKLEGRFERASIDVLQLELEDVGEVRKLRLGLKAPTGKNSPSRPRWRPVKVELVNMNTDKTVAFLSDSWLSLEPDKKTGTTYYADLSAVTAKGEAALNTTTYTVSVVTATEMGAGTDSNVRCVVSGEFGDSGELELRESTTNRNKFESGHTDVFTFPQMLSLGRLIKMRIWHDSSGIGAAWLLDSVSVHDSSADITYVFPCGRWLSVSEGLSRELVCAEKHSDDPYKDSAEENADYEISVVTGDKRNAGTVHHLWLVLIGTNDRSDKIWLENSARNRILRRGDTDVVRTKRGDLGPIERIRLALSARDDVPMQDGGNVDERETSWFCQQITVTAIKSGQRYVFPCSSWIEMRSKDGVELQCAATEADAVKTEQNRPLIDYEVSVVTGDAFGAGTDADVDCCLHGDRGDTGNRPLKQDWRNLFERAQTDTFHLEASDLGTLQRLSIGHNAKGMGSGWLLDCVEVRNSQTGVTTTFPCGKWLDKSKGDKLIRRELYPA